MTDSFGLLEPKVGGLRNHEGCSNGEAAPGANDFWVNFDCRRGASSDHDAFSWGGRPRADGEKERFADYLASEWVP